MCPSQERRFGRLSGSLELPEQHLTALGVCYAKPLSSTRSSLCTVHQCLLEHSPATLDTTRNRDVLNRHAWYSSEQIKHTRMLLMPLLPAETLFKHLEYRRSVLPRSIAGREGLRRPSQPRCRYASPSALQLLWSKDNKRRSCSSRARRAEATLRPGRQIQIHREPRSPQSGCSRAARGRQRSAWPGKASDYVHAPFKLFSPNPPGHR